MSGIITGPYFKAYFGDPGAGELGLMVSVLEIGALSMSFEKFAATSQKPHSVLMLHSYLARRRAHWRRDRSQGHSLYRRSRLHHWWGNSNLHGGDLQYGRRSVYLWVWRRFVVVSALLVHCNRNL